MGYGLADEDIIQKLDPSREPFNVNTFGQKIAVVALEDQAFIEKCSAENQKGLQQYYEFCDSNNLTYYSSQGNFIFIHFEQDADVVFQYLLERGYIARSGKSFGFPKSVRVTIGSLEENEGMIHAIKSFLNEVTLPAKSLR